MRLVLFGLGILPLFINGCVAPYRLTTSISPSFRTCEYATYAFRAPEDETLSKWLSDPKHVQILQDLMRAPLNEHGLREIPADGAAPDLWIYQHLESKQHAANEAPDGVVASTDYRYANWIVKIVPENKVEPVWTVDMDMLVGDLESQNVSTARRGVKNASSGFPTCQARKTSQ